MARLRQVIIKLNIGLARAVEFLNSKGGNFDDDNPNAKLTSEQEQMLLREFGTDEMIKQESDRLMQERIEKEREKEEVKQDKAEEPKPVEEIVISVELPHLKPVATIDLDAVGKPPVKTEEKPAAPVETPKPAPQPDQEKPVEAPAEPRREAQPDEVFTYRKVEFENNLKMVGKIDLNAINDATRPTKKSKDAKRKDRVEKPTAKATAPSAPAKKEEIFRTDIPQLDGPHTVGKIALTDEPGSRKKRKRIGKNERVDINKVSGGVRDKKNKRSIHVANVSEEDVALQIKETLARLTENKRSNKKAADYRKNKREAVAQRQQEQAAAERRAEGILKLTEFVTANDLATMMNVPVTQVIQTCFNLGLFVSINQRLDAETINIVADEFEIGRAHV